MFFATSAVCVIREHNIGPDTLYMAEGALQLIITYTGQGLCRVAPPGRAGGDVRGRYPEDFSGYVKFSVLSRRKAFKTRKVFEITGSQVADVASRDDRRHRRRPGPRCRPCGVGRQAR